ncbi:sugar ABC transporter substrate-binding protein [Salinisphaera sp. USBA-960]|uniref:substrate-binding domain-containing protein n=1 Tax=Salinisphaera orenii TaxID=856731 RepID=UPI000DBE26A5|nr:sugar ABC transporter substrate-binding protein [Salifodinibacter halophilus]NNC25676.1 sugar ABC transporter substrate-binding protein [Salifodinibacter halophilus]
MYRSSRLLRLAGGTLTAACLCFAAGNVLAADNESGQQLKFAMVTHAQKGDTFWDIERKGGKQAAKNVGAQFIYSNHKAAGKQVTLVENAINQDVDGIAVTLAHPDAMKSVIKKAHEADIPVVGFNSGVAEWHETEANMFIGQDPQIAGKAVGKKLNELDAKHVLCVNHGQGNKALSRRCAGIKKTLDGDYSLVYVNGQSMSSVRSRVIAKLQQDRSIDYVVALGAPYAMTVVRSLPKLGRDVQVGTFDLNQSVAKAIQSGKLQWAVDQQPFLQGYLAIEALYLKATNGNTIGGGKAVLTGPSFVTKDNVDELLKYAKQGTRG